MYIKIFARCDKGSSSGKKLREHIKSLEKELSSAKRIHEDALKENESDLKTLTQRLVIKSVWFRTQLIKLERKMHLVMAIDEVLLPSLSCPSCLGLLNNPQVLIFANMLYELFKLVFFHFVGTRFFIRAVMLNVETALLLPTW